MSCIMTGQERLHRLFFHEEMDRPAVIARWWGFRDDPSHEPLLRTMRQRADWVEPWNAWELVGNVPFTANRNAGQQRRWLLADREDAERYLDLPMPEISGDTSAYFRLVREVGECGIVQAHLCNNPGGEVAELFGSECFALMSITDRDILHALMARFLRIKLDLLQFLLEHGIGPYFSMHGEEMIAPPLHGRADFFDFNVRYDRVIADRIHAAGGRLNVHCHGRVRTVIDGFDALGADVFHCFEAPPMGDIPPAEVRHALPEMGLEGNIQIADMYERDPDDIRQQAHQLIRDCFVNQRGLAVSPTASPFMRGRGAEALPRYTAMVDAVTSWRD